MNTLKQHLRQAARKIMSIFLVTRFGKMFLSLRYIKTNRVLVRCLEKRDLDRKGTEILSFFKKTRRGMFCKSFIEQWLEEDEGGKYINIRGAKLPNIITNSDIVKNFYEEVFRDVFLIPSVFDDDYNKTIVNKLFGEWGEGPYGYRDGKFDVSVKAGDVVIDAGAWIGDFSAYSASKGADVYAFEPSPDMFSILCNTARLNGGKIHPVQRGLGKENCKLPLYNAENDYLGWARVVNNSSAKDMWGGGGGGRYNIVSTIDITSLDAFVEKNKIKKIDFIKADIEGSERDMLHGAVNVLKNFAPKLAICTYHLPDDPEVLSKKILDANPRYKIIHLRKKLFASVVY